MSGKHKRVDTGSAPEPRPEFLARLDVRMTDAEIADLRRERAAVATQVAEAEAALGPMLQRLHEIDGQLRGGVTVRPVRCVMIGQGALGLRARRLDSGAEFGLAVVPSRPEPTLISIQQCHVDPAGARR